MKGSEVPDLGVRLAQGAIDAVSGDFTVPEKKLEQLKTLREYVDERIVEIRADILIREREHEGEHENVDG